MRKWNVPFTHFKGLSRQATDLNLPKSLRPLAVATKPTSTAQASEPNRQNSRGTPAFLTGIHYGVHNPSNCRPYFDGCNLTANCRTNDELADEMFAALPFSRRGAKIEAALKRTIAKG